MSWNGAVTWREDMPFKGRGLVKDAKFITHDPNSSPDENSKTPSLFLRAMALDAKRRPGRVDTSFPMTSGFHQVRRRALQGEVSLQFDSGSSRGAASLDDKFSTQREFRLVLIDVACKWNKSARCNMYIVCGLVVEQVNTSTHGIVYQRLGVGSIFIKTRLSLKDWMRQHDYEELYLI
jgi:hypothetical protein